MENPFGITREEVLELAAKKLADDYGDGEDLERRAYSTITKRIEELIASGIKGRIDAFLDAEMTKIVSQEIVPVNIWGQREGAPTTIRAELAKRAQEFWNLKVNKDGREDFYGGEERSKRLMKQMMIETFSAAVKENIDQIVLEFKAALKTDAAKMATEHINTLINITEKRH